MNNTTNITADWNGMLEMINQWDNEGLNTSELIQLRELLQAGQTSIEEYIATRTLDSNGGFLEGHKVVGFVGDDQIATIRWKVLYDNKTKECKATIQNWFYDIGIIEESELVKSRLDNLETMRVSDFIDNYGKDKTVNDVVGAMTEVMLNRMYDKVEKVENDYITIACVDEGDYDPDNFTPDYGFDIQDTDSKARNIIEVANKVYKDSDDYYDKISFDEFQLLAGLEQGNTVLDDMMTLVREKWLDKHSLVW